MDPIPLNTILLEQLGLVRPDQWSAIQRRARRIGGRKGVRQKVPGTFSACTFSAIWIDAMLQLGHITPYQAKQLQEGEGESLRVGPYVLWNRRESLGWADCFDAYRIDNRRRVYLAVLRNGSLEVAESLREKFREEKGTFCAQRSQAPFFPFLSVQEVGFDDRAGGWIAATACAGESVAQRIVQHGRFSPVIVLEIARQMARALRKEKGVRNLLPERPGGCFAQKIPDTFFSEEEETGKKGTGTFCAKRDQASFSPHGDLRATTVLLDREGGLKLLLPGVRTVIRPRESFAETAGPIDLYDGLSPERAAEGTVADMKSDLFAAGSLWWQMLVGRSPMPGGDGRAKLRAAARGRIEDIRQHAAEVPEPLARAIEMCTARDPGDRPESFNKVTEILGEPDARGARALRRMIRGNRVTALPTASAASTSRQDRYLSWAVIAIVILIPIVALGLAANHFFHPPEPKVVVLPKPLPPKPISKNRKKVDSVPSVTPTGNNGGEVVLPAATTRTESKEIVLDAKQPTSVESLVVRLKPGVVVTGPARKRAQVVIGDHALTIAVPDVRFEGIDFVTAKPSEKTSGGSASPNNYRVMIELSGGEATFVGCTFHSERGKKSAPWTVVHWIFPNAGRSPEISKKLPGTLHNGRIVFENCVFGRETGTALHAEVHAAVALELRNVLHLGAGPMIFLESPPTLEEPWRIRADRVTLRDSGPFWACRYRSTRAGAVRIETSDSVFAPKGIQPLLLFVGENDPEPIFRKIEWTGRETLIKKTTPTAAWQDNRGNRDPLGDLRALIDGLARSQMEFCGPADRDSSSSVLETWDAPLTSETPPGIDAERLPP